MALTSSILHGNSIRQTTPPAMQGNVKVLLPGMFQQTCKSIGIDDDILSKHILLMGGTGCGKTNLFFYFIRQLKASMSENDVMIIFDTKGDYFSRFHTPGDIVLSNSKQYADVMSKWNIFREIVADGWEDEDVLSNTYEITRSLFRDAVEDSGQPFFPSAARDLLAALIVAHIRMGTNDPAFRKKFLNNKELKYYLDITNPKKITSLLSAFPDLASVLTYIGDGSSDQALGVMAELQSVIRQIFIGAFSGDGRFSVRKFVREKSARTLFIEYDLSIGETLVPIYRLLFDLALKEAMGRRKSEGNVYFICDEFKLLPHLQHIEDGVNFGRSLGVKIMAGIQSVEQLFEIYGDSKGKNIAAGFSSIFAFKSNDTGSRNYVSELYGKNIVLDQYKTANNTLVEEKRDGNTVEDWELTNLSVGEAIVGLPFQMPFRFQFDLYRG